MRCNTLIGRWVFSAFTILIVLSLSFNPSLAAIGIPHIIYGKISNSGGMLPVKDYLKIYAYIPSRPGELLDKSTVGCGYDIFFDGWLWFEAGNYLTPWSINENLRIIAVDTQRLETDAIDLALDSSGSQFLPVLVLQDGDHVDPIASNSMADGASPASIPEGRASITLTASLDDSLCGNSNIKAAEYFVDGEPVFGSGKMMNPEDGSFNSHQEGVTALVNTSSWVEGSTHNIYIRGQDFAGNLGTSHMVVVSVTKPIRGDIDRDGDVDKDDNDILRSHLYEDDSECPECDLDGDGEITALDSRILVTLCTRPRCATQ